MDETEVKIPGFFNNKPSDLITEHREYYLMVNAISKRVRQLQLGDRALALPADGSRDPLYIAQEEFLRDKLVITPRSVGLHFLEFEEDAGPDMDALLGVEEDEVNFGISDDEE